MRQADHNPQRDILRVARRPDLNDVAARAASEFRHAALDLLRQMQSGQLSDDGRKRLDLHGEEFGGLCVSRPLDLDRNLRGRRMQPVQHHKDGRQGRRACRDGFQPVIAPPSHRAALSGAASDLSISEHRPATLQRPPARRGLQCPVWRFHKQAAGRGSYVPAQDREAGRSFLFIRQPIANERPGTGGMKLRQIGEPLGLTPKTAGGHRMAHRRFDPVTIFGGVV